MLVHIGANTQLGGLKLGLFNEAYQGFSWPAVILPFTKPPMFGNRIAPAICKLVQTIFLIVLKQIVVSHKFNDVQIFAIKIFEKSRKGYVWNGWMSNAYMHNALISTYISIHLV